MRNSSPDLNMFHAISRFFEKVDTTSKGCWNWQGSSIEKNHSNGQRYGCFAFLKITGQAHRASFFIFNGYLTKGLTIDHKCFNTICVNPKHLREISERENILSGRTSCCAVLARRTHCPNGHEFSKENTTMRLEKRNGKLYRSCHTCTYNRNKKRRLMLADKALKGMVRG